MADGSITFSVNLDGKDAEKELMAVKKKILDLEAQMQVQGKRKPVLVAEMEKAAQAADEAKAKVRDLMESGASTSVVKEAESRAKELDAEYNKAADAVDKYDRKMQDTSDELEKQKLLYGEIAKGAEDLDHNLEETPDHIDKSASMLEKFEKRVVGLVKRVFVFSVITTALRGLRNWFADVIKTDKDAVAAIAQLKGALLTLVQPLVGVVIPAFTTFVQVLTQVVSALASVVSAIMGTTAEQSAEAAENLNAEKKALDGVGASAKKAGKSLASFDEINKISTTDDAGTGGRTTSTGTEIAPDFSFLDGASERMKEIADWVLFIGAGFALWKLGDFLGGLAEAFPALSNLLGPLGDIATKLGGIVIAAAGVVLAWDGLKDAWENGVDWGNMAEMIGGVALAAIGLGIAFGPVWAGIALVVGGLAMLVTGFHDAMENGWNLQNTLLAIAGLLATGLGFFFITGSVIPLVIAGIAALLLAMTVATGHGEELLTGIRTIVEGFLDFFTGIFTGDMEKAVGGINKIFEGLGMVVHAIIDGVRDTIFGFMDWLDEKTGGRFHGIIQAAKDIVGGFFDQVNGVVDGAMLGLKGLVEFITGVFTGDWDLAWEGIKDMFKGVVNAILGFWIGGINLMIKAMNFVIDKMNGLSFDIPDWVPKFGGEKFGINLPRLQEYQIPKLAQGAVIPPNREFMAVLGDQSSGNNLEAPEELLRQIVREEGGGNYMAILQQILEAIKDGKILLLNDEIFARMVHDAEMYESDRQGVPLVKVR